MHRFLDWALCWKSHDATQQHVTGPSPAIALGILPTGVRASRMASGCKNPAVTGWIRGGQTLTAPVSTGPGLTTTSLEWVIQIPTSVNRNSSYVVEMSPCRGLPRLAHDKERGGLAPGHGDGHASRSTTAGGGPPSTDFFCGGRQAPRQLLRLSARSRRGRIPPPPPPPCPFLFVSAGCKGHTPCPSRAPPPTRTL